MPALTQTATPLRNLTKIAEELRANDVNVSQYFVNDSNVLHYDQLARADIQQLAQDAKRLMSKFYFNGVPLVDIVHDEQIIAMRERLTNFVGMHDHPDQRQQAVQEIYQFYLTLTGKAGTNKLTELTPDEFTEFVRYYDNHSDDFQDYVADKGKQTRYQLYLTLTGKKSTADFSQLAADELKEFELFRRDNAVLLNKALNENDWLSKVNNEFYKGFENFFNEIDATAFWSEVIKKHLLVGLGPEQQQGLLNFMELYAHQGGILFAPYTIIMRAFASTGQFHDLGQLNVANNNTENATFEFNVKNGQLEVRETSSLLKIGYGMHEETEEEMSAELDNRKFDWQNEKMGRLLDFQINHVVSYNAENEDKFDFTTKHDESIVYSYDDDFWQVVQNKLTEDERLQKMQKALQDYTDNVYLKGGHDIKKANELIKEFPEIKRFEPISHGGFFRQRYPNRLNSIFTALNVLAQDLAGSIIKNFNYYVRAGLQPFTYAIKLLHRLGQKKQAADLLAPYNHTNLSQDDLLEQKSIEKLHPEILKDIEDQDRLKAIADAEALETQQKLTATAAAEAAAIAAEKYFYPASSIRNVTTMPLRDIAAITDRVGSDNVIVKDDLEGGLVKPELYREKDIKQFNADFIRNQGRIYVNGVQAKEIVEKVRLDYFKMQLNTALNGDENQISALQDFYDLYNLLNGRPKMPIDKASFTPQIDQMAQFYRENTAIFKDLRVQNKNGELENLLSTLAMGQYELIDGEQTHEMTRTILNNYFLAHIQSDEEKVIIRNVIEKFDHQGGYAFAAIAAIEDALADVMSISDKITRPKRGDGDTTEYQAIRGGIQVREVTSLKAIGHMSVDGDYVADFAMPIPGVNIIEFETIHEITIDPSADDKYKLSVQTAKAHIYHPESWNFISHQIDQAEKFKAMRPVLRSYVKNYLEKDHDDDAADMIFQTFPEIKTYTASVPPVAAFDSGFRLFGGANKPDERDRLFEMLGKIESLLPIKGDQKSDYVKTELLGKQDFLSNEKIFVKTLRLAIAMGERQQVLDFLKPHNAGNYSDEKLLTKAVIRELYTKVKPNNDTSLRPSNPS